MEDVWEQKTEEENSRLLPCAQVGEGTSGSYMPSSVGVGVLAFVSRPDVSPQLRYTHVCSECLLCYLFIFFLIFLWFCKVNTFYCMRL